MHYFAGLHPTTKVCNSITEVDDITYEENVAEGYEYENENSIAISSYDASLLYRKKYINGEWLDATPDEAAVYDAHLTKCNGKWLDELTGDVDDLSTTNKTSLVAAINELYGMIQAIQTNS